MAEKNDYTRILCEGISLTILGQIRHCKPYILSFYLLLFTVYAF